MEEVSKLEEFEGLYGLVGIPEKLLQRWWRETLPDVKELKTTEGKSLEIIDPGRWNALEGPDFLKARIQIGGQLLEGDVEVHFREEDWFLHQHEGDPRYHRVVLHALLFPDPAPPRPGAFLPPHTVVLLPWLQEDLESLAEEEYRLESLRLPLDSFAPEGWASLTPHQRRRKLRVLAETRYQHLVQRAHFQVQRHGWKEACHQMTLDLLGLPRNREGFARLGRRYPLAAFAETPVDVLWDELRPDLHLRGMRPANQPKPRLFAYHRWVQRHPDWPTMLRAVEAPALVRLLDFSEPRTIGLLRKQLPWSAWRQSLTDALGQPQLGPGKEETLWVSAWLPLLAAKDPEAYWSAWFIWPPTDLPTGYRLWLKLWEICSPRDFPQSTGWDQGALLLQRNTNQQ